MGGSRPIELLPEGLDVSMVIMYVEIRHMRGDRRSDAQGDRHEEGGLGSFLADLGAGSRRDEARTADLMERKGGELGVDRYGIAFEIETTVGVELAGWSTRRGDTVLIREWDVERAWI